MGFKIVGLCQFYKIIFSFVVVVGGGVVSVELGGKILLFLSLDPPLLRFHTFLSVRTVFRHLV